MSIEKSPVVAWLLTGSVMFAHQDRIIRLDEGKLEGLPPKYQPASFSISERKIGAGQLVATIPDCIWKLFANAQEGEFRFFASWYHERSILPPYVLISVPEAGTKNHFELLLNLDTLAPIALTKVIQTSDSSWSHRRIPLEESCLSRWSVLRKEGAE